MRRKSRKVLSKDEVSFSREEIIVPPDFIFVMRKKIQYLSQNIPLSFNVSILLILIGILGNILWISPSFLNHSRSLHMFQESWELIHSTNCLSAAAKSEYILHTFQIITEVQILNPYLCPPSFSQSLSLVHTRAYMCLFHSVSLIADASNEAAYYFGSSPSGAFFLVGALTCNICKSLIFSRLGCLPENSSLFLPRIYYHVNIMFVPSCFICRLWLLPRSP